MARSKKQLDDAAKARFSHRRLCFCLEDEIQAKADAILKDKKKSVKNIAAHIAKLIVENESSKSSSNTSRSNEELQKELHILQNKLDSLTTLMITTQNYMQQFYSNGQILPVQNLNLTQVYEPLSSNTHPTVSQEPQTNTTQSVVDSISSGNTDNVSKTDSLFSGSTPETNVSTAPTSSYPDFEDDNDDDMDEIYNSMKMF